MARHLYNHTFVFDFEDLSLEDLQAWMVSIRGYSWIYSAVYVAAIFGIKRYMRDRERFELRSLLALWNVLLALFSLLAAIRYMTALINVWIHEGFYNTVCLRGEDRILGFWSLLTVLSKLVEFGDTIFIVLRKQNLIFLHWYHHITVLIYSWYSSSGLNSTGTWFLGVNTVVHAVMYSYYASKAMRFNPPKKIAILITSLQIAQMVFAIYINIKVRQWRREGLQCDVTYFDTNLALLLYASFFVLFANFFMRSYLFKNKNVTKKVQ